MPVTTITEIRNNSSYNATIRNNQYPDQTNGIGTLAPGATSAVHLEVPWCGDGANFPTLHIDVTVGSMNFVVWQAMHVEGGQRVDRVRVSTTQAWAFPGDEIGLFPSSGPIENLPILGDRTLILNDRSLWLGPRLLPDTLNLIGNAVRGAGYRVWQDSSTRPIPSVPKRSPVSAFSMAGRGAKASDVTSAYKDSGKRYTFEVRDQVNLEGRMANGVVFATDSSGSTPLTQAVSFNNKRVGEMIPLPEFDLIAASRDRVFAKEKGCDRFYFAVADEQFVDRFNGQPYSIPSLYFKVDPEFNQPTANPADLRQAMAGDFHGHRMTDRYSVFRFGLSFGLLDTMVVKVEPRKWYLLDMRPQCGLQPVVNSVAPQLSNLETLMTIAPGVHDLLAKILDFVRSFDRTPPAGTPQYSPVTWAQAGGANPLAMPAVDFQRVLDIGAGNVHYHDQYEGTTGGEIQELLSTSPDPTNFSQDYPELYRFLNGPLQDADGFCDGTCNYYILVQLRDGSYRILFTDEQSYFCGRWRILHPDDHLALQFSLIKDIADDKAKYNGRRYMFDPSHYWDPFLQPGLVNEYSRMAVAAQVLLVTGGGGPGTNTGEIYSINFSWGTMDRTWRWRQVPATPYYYDPIALNGAEPNVDNIPASSCYPQTLRLREDMTMHLRGKDSNGRAGHWFQRYLPSSLTMPWGPPGTRPGAYSHPWKFMLEAAYNRADQYSHFGVYADVDSRMQYYVVTGDVSKFQQGLDSPWSESSRISTDGYTFSFEWLRNPWLPVPGPPTPPPKIQKCPPSAYNGATLLRIVPRGNTWIAMLWDKRDDDLIAFSNVGQTVTMNNGKAGQTDITLVSYHRMPAPPDVPVACFWFQPDGRPVLGFTASKGVGLDGIWQVHVAAFDSQTGAPTAILDVNAADCFTPTPLGFYQYVWTPAPDQQTKLRTFCTPDGALAGGTSIWFEDVTGHVSVPDFVGWQRGMNITCTASSDSVELGVPVTLTINAHDAVTGVPVAGRVLVDELDVAPTNVPFTYTFNQRQPDPPDTGGKPGPIPKPVNPSISVVADYYVEGYVKVTFYKRVVAAQFVTQSVPSSMTAGHPFPVSVTMRNSGNVTWTPGGANPFRLGAQNPQDNMIWGMNRQEVPGTVPPGGQVTFSFSVNAPAAPGSYNFQWRMLQELVEWFGDFSPNVGVQVMAPTLSVTAIPSNINLDEPVQVMVRAVDAVTSAPVQGTVKVNGQAAGNTNVQFTYTFRGRIVHIKGGPGNEIPPSVAVSAPGYPDAPVSISFNPSI